MTTPAVSPPTTGAAVRRLVLVPAGRRSADQQLRRFRLALTTLEGRPERVSVERRFSTP